MFIQKNKRDISLQYLLEKHFYCWAPVILATQKAEIRRIKVQSQPRRIVHETLFQKNPSQESAGGTAQGVGPEFKLQYPFKRKIF
jgi:hypothetical protein